MSLSSPLSHPRVSVRLTEAAAPDAQAAVTTSPTLWYAARFPHLALAACGADEQADVPQAVIESDSEKARLIDVNAIARRGGVQAGAGVASALALLPMLEIRRRDAARETKLLEQLAGWCEQFTPTVCVTVPDMLLLEVAGSAHLFGGIEGLQQRMRDGLQALRHPVCIALAPTPGAAEWLVRSGCETAITDAVRLPAVLGSLPLAALPWPAAWQTRFQQLGLHCVRDLLRLPRDGLARRFSPGLLQTCDRVLGKRPDPRTPHQPPVHFSATQELPAETANAAYLQPYIGCLFDALCEALRQHDAVVGKVELRFRHQGMLPTTLPLGLLAPTRDAQRWRQLLHEPLQRLALPQAVTEITLTSSDFLRYAPVPADLFARGGHSGETLATLMDRLRLRLGGRGILRLRALPDHRPERAWRGSAQPQHSVHLPTATRPLWLFDPPQRLQVRERTLLLQGQVLTLLGGAERIESGWWDGNDLARDYYPARTADGRRVWIYRERGAAEHWFVHGLFA